ncbi:zinc metalloprotease HtpX [Candidatus Babeliales bacterium]|nr:zinc metalloprotease HtpX [Candidatus Babeliales bacterium]
MIYSQFKTFVLLAALTGALLFMGGMFGGSNGIKYALIFAFILNGISYFFSDKIVLSMYGAQPLSREKYDWIYQIVEELCHEARLPMPKLWFVNNPMANAFATGRNPSHASVAITAGILEILDQRELRGVLAHEISHIKNRDILVGSIAATIAMAIGYLADLARWSFFWGDRRNNRQSGVGIFGVILISILVPLAATLIQLAITRSREYLADESGAKHSQDPLALADALEKLHHAVPKNQKQEPSTVQAATASLFIVYPFSTKGLFNLFSTHPPMEKRIARLHAMAEKMMP